MIKKKFSKSAWKKVVAAALAAAVTSGTGYFVLKQQESSITIPAYTVAEVLDGDTFITVEGLYIRLAYINAPESELCGAVEAKNELKRLLLEKTVYLKILYRDQFQRLDSLVYTNEGLINLLMVQKGLAQYRLAGKNSPESNQLKLEGSIARNNKLGIYSDKCTQDQNLKNPKCNIKGNAGQIKNHYYYPGCGNYDNTIVQLYLGDQWFCTRQEAEKAGFQKATFCPD